MANAITLTDINANANANANITSVAIPNYEQHPLPWARWTAYTDANQTANYLRYYGVALDDITFDLNRDVQLPAYTQDVLYYPNRNAYFRKSSCDDQFWSEIRTHEKVGITQDDRIMDIGGNAGLYSIWCFQRYNPRTVTVFEPDQDNVNLICLNSGLRQTGDRTIVVQAAVVPRNYPYSTVTFYRNLGNGKGMHSLMPRRGRKPVIVNAVPWDYALSLCRPTAIKMDIEGGEYQFITTFLQHDAFPNYIKKITVEFHLTNTRWRTDYAPLLRTALCQHFAEVEAPILNDKRWMARFVGVR